MNAAEALLRWPHPDDGLLSPDLILSVAERGGLLREIDRWVLHTALHEAATWPTTPAGPVDIAINLGSQLPHDPEFPATVSQAITLSGIDPARVIIEITETALIHLPTPARGDLTTLAEAGVRLALDDFGTGHSSLARLTDLPAHILKLDRQFITGLGHDPRDLGILQAVTDLARGLGHLGKLSFRTGMAALLSRCDMPRKVLGLHEVGQPARASGWRQPKRAHSRRSDVRSMLTKRWTMP